MSDDVRCRPASEEETRKALEAADFISDMAREVGAEATINAISVALVALAISAGVSKAQLATVLQMHYDVLKQPVTTSIDRAGRKAKA